MSFFTKLSISDVSIFNIWLSRRHQWRHTKLTSQIETDHLHSSTRTLWPHNHFWPSLIKALELIVDATILEISRRPRWKLPLCQLVSQNSVQSGEHGWCVVISMSRVSTNYVRITAILISLILRKRLTINLTFLIQLARLFGYKRTAHENCPRALLYFPPSVLFSHSILSLILLRFVHGEIIDRSVEQVTCLSVYLQQFCRETLHLGLESAGSIAAPMPRILCGDRQSWLPFKSKVTTTRSPLYRGFKTSPSQRQRVHIHQRTELNHTWRQVFAFYFPLNLCDGTGYFQKVNDLAQIRYRVVQRDPGKSAGVSFERSMSDTVLNERNR